MKILFFLALLANLVFFLWQYNAGAFGHTTDKTELAISESKQIWLVSEMEKKLPVNRAATPTPPPATHQTSPATVMALAKTNTPQQSVTSAAVHPVQPLPVPSQTAPIANVAAPAPSLTPALPMASVKAVYCYQVQGFADKTAVTRWAQQQTIDPKALQLKETAPVVADYLVNYPAAATFAESKKNIAVLKNHGINTFFMINQGEFKGAISLGVFKSEARAIKAQQVLIQKGINAKVTPRYKTAPVISAQIKTEKTKPELLLTLAGHAPKASVELLSKCE